MICSIFIFKYILALKKIISLKRKMKLLQLSMNTYKDMYASNDCTCINIVIITFNKHDKYY